MKHAVVAIALFGCLGAACSSGGNDHVDVDASITSCGFDDSSGGIPVAEVDVTNTGSKSASFDVKVRFMQGDTVLGVGEEYTDVLGPKQGQNIRMGIGDPDDGGGALRCEIASTSKR